MFHDNRSLSLLFTTIIACTTATHLTGAVDDITGDTGSAQTGSLTLSGGTSGGVFDSTTSTITQSFDFLKLPLTSSTEGQIIIDEETVLHTYGPSNQNLFVGSSAGNFSTTGAYNTGCGTVALNLISSGSGNTAVGHAPLTSLTTGGSNVAIGDNAGLTLITGNSNILIGANAGTAYESDETNNILIGHLGFIDEDNTIHIGGGDQTQTSCYIDGIYGSTVNSGSGIAAYIDDTGKIGTIVSSAQFKEKIADIGNDSKPIMKLRPVSYYLKNDSNKLKQFGLIAEEVYKIFPGLVVLDKNGKPYAVRYHELPVLMLNELQKQADRIATLENLLKEQSDCIAKLESHLRK